MIPIINLTQKRIIKQRLRKYLILTNIHITLILNDMNYLTRFLNI